MQIQDGKWDDHGLSVYGMRIIDPNWDTFCVKKASVKRT